MKRWAPAFVWVLLLCLPILLVRNADPKMLADTDTVAILSAITERHDPMSWFRGDWPLGNHFYRPISSLAFEMDLALHGSSAAGFGLTNALLCVACTLLLFWFLREFTDRPILAAAGSTLFALWTVDALSDFRGYAFYLAAFGLIPLFLPQRDWKKALMCAALILYVAFEVQGLNLLRYRMVEWIPGRTASVMAVFCLAALASLTRYERLSASLLPAPERTPLDPPATKNTLLRDESPKYAWLWATVGLVCVALALASYEQAVMLPGVICAVMVGMRWQRYQVRWGWTIGAFVLLGGYLILRRAVVPSDVSTYQAQQFRNGPGLWQDLVYFVFPMGIGVFQTIKSFDWMMLMIPSPYVAITNAIGNVVALSRLRKRPPFAVVGFVTAFLAYLPMAWLKVFDHYYYWPMAMRSLFVACLIGMAAELWVSAMSRPTRSAPLRLDPAPGSLRRP